MCLVHFKGNTIYTGGKDDVIKKWDYKSGKCVKTLKGHKEAVRTLSISSNGLLISGSEDKTVKLWENDKCKLTIG